MTNAFSADKTVLVLRGYEFFKCIACKTKSGITVKLDNDGVLISIGGVEFHREFSNTPETMGEICFVLVDPTQKMNEQLIGIAERDQLEWSDLGRVHLLK